MKLGFGYLLWILTFTAAYADEFARHLCDQEATEAKLLQPWKKKEGKFCTEVFCQVGKNTIKREKCFYQQEHENEVVMTYNDMIDGPEVAGMKGHAEFVRLHDVDACYVACRPEKRKILGISVKDAVGLKRESCQECFKKREHFKYDSSFHYQEVGKRLFPSQKCYQMCIDPLGPILQDRKLTVDCEKCVGLNGHAPEQFDYVLTKRNECLEIDQSLERRLVPNHFCASTDVIYTQYQQASSYTLKTIFLKKKPDCFEVDDRTVGGLYKISVNPSRCERPVTDNTDRSIIPDKSHDSDRKVKPASGASRQ